MNRIKRMNRIKMVGLAALVAAGCATTEDEGAKVFVSRKAYGTMTSVMTLPKACRSVATVKGEAPSLLPDGHEFKVMRH